VVASVPLTEMHELIAHPKKKEKKKKEHELSWPLGLNLSSGPTHSNPDFEPCKAQAWDNLPTPSQTAKETRKNSNETPQL